MKSVLAVLLILLLLLVALPMGMGGMADCPACTPSKAPFALALCAGTLSMLSFGLLLTGTRLRLRSEARYRFLSIRSIYRPPRFV